MIEFTCSCGKKYRQPDRNAGREVRCYQCEKTLIVPKQSQKTSIVPVSEQPAPIIEPKVTQPDAAIAVPTATKQIVVERNQVTTTVTPTAEVSPFSTMADPTTTESPFSVTTPSVTVSSPVATATVSTPKTSAVAAVIPSRVSGTATLNILVLLLVASIGAGIVGVFLGRLSVGSASSSGQGTEEQGAVQSEDEQAPSQNLTSSTGGYSTPKFTAADWKIDRDSWQFFDIRTADGTPAKLSLDVPSTTSKSGKQLVRAEIAIATDDEQSGKGTDTHTISLRIDSESSEEICVVWPNSRNAALRKDEIQELKFSINFPGRAGAVHDHDELEILDEIPEFTDFRLRFGDAFGDMEFVLAETERINLCEKGRIGWWTVSVPVDGNDHWRRTERGRMATVDFIEFRATPTKSGVAFRIGNPSIRGE